MTIVLIDKFKGQDGMLNYMTNCIVDRHQKVVLEMQKEIYGKVFSEETIEAKVTYYRDASTVMRSEVLKKKK